MRSRWLALAAGLISGLPLPPARVLQAQSLSLGVKGGVPLTDPVEGSFGSQSQARRYTVGPMVEIGLPFSLAVEIDALYKRTGYNSTFSGFASLVLTQARANSWEFPVLLKYYLAGRGLRPYVGGGYVVRHLSGVGGYSRGRGIDLGTGLPFDLTFPVRNSPFFFRDNPTHGVAAQAGLQFRAGRLRLAPEVRYTRWTGRAFDEQGSRGFFLQSVQNQFEFLFGLSF